MEKSKEQEKWKYIRLFSISLGVYGPNRENAFSISNCSIFAGGAALAGASQKKKRRNPCKYKEFPRFCFMILFSFAMTPPFGWPK